MSLKRRPDLGFDGGYSDEDLESPQKNIPIRKAKLPKLSFKTQDLETKDIDEVRPTLGKAKHSSSNSDDDDDYMKMKITDSEQTGPQRLQVVESTKKRPQYSFEHIHDEKKEQKPTSLFGQLDNANNKEDTSKVVMESMPNSQLKSSSKGLSIMEKMGFKIGHTLGKDSQNKNAILEPSFVSQRKDRTGLREKPIENNENEVVLSGGMTNEAAKEFRERLNGEKIAQKQEKTLHKMQKYCWEFSGDDDIVIEKVDPLGINVLWRGYVKFIQKLLKDKREQQRIKDPSEILEIDGDTNSEGENDGNDDEELELFEEMTMEEKISKVHIFLRSEYNYCYYCGVKYEDQGELFQYCPGFSEEDHD